MQKQIFIIMQQLHAVFRNTAYGVAVYLIAAGVAVAAALGFDNSELMTACCDDAPQHWLLYSQRSIRGCIYRAGLRRILPAQRSEGAG